MIKNLLFDLGGVIVPLNRIACLRAFSDVIGYKDFGNILTNYRRVGIFEKYEKGSINSRKFRAGIRKDITSDPKGLTKQVTDSQIDYCLNCFLLPIPQDRIEALLFYKSDYHMFLLSNTNPIGMRYCRKLFRDKGYYIADIFEELFLSYQLKSAKPHREIFEKMIKKSKMVPEETLFIDDMVVNLETAASMSFKTLLYDPKKDLYKTIEKRLIELENNE